jgi:DNA-directed RNA polymerase specialized sigma24 family protein
LSKQVQRLWLDQAPDVEGDPGSQLREIDEALTGLEAVDPKLRRVVEMKVFEGRSIEEIASELGCVTRTVDRYWSVARAILRQHFGEPE